MTRSPVVGLMLPTSANTASGRVEPRRVIEAARRAEAAGFDGVYVGDHLMHPRPLLEAIVTLSAVAATTQRVAIGTCVMLAALRHPLWLAKQLGTLDSFAPGRLRIGIGVGGEYKTEFAAAGVKLAERGRRAEEVVQQVRDLLAGAVNFAPSEGDAPSSIDPIPQGRVPFLFAGWKEVALQRAARLGDGWIGYLLSAASFARRRSLLLDYRTAISSEPFVTGMLLPVHPDAHRDGASARAAAAWAAITKNAAAFPERLFVAGPPADIVEQLRSYWDAGCSEMVLSVVDQGDGYLDQLDILADEVLPHLRTFS